MAIKKAVKSVILERPERVDPRGPEAVGLPFDVGDAILIRTVTMIQVGRVTKIGSDFFVLEDASWIADTDRFGKMLETGSIAELERCPSWVLVGRGAVVDVFPWAHALPEKTK